MTSAKYIPQLDGIRGLAVLAVMASHLMPYVLPPRQSLAARLFSQGVLGVDLFFVLSGFLITGILVDTRKNQKFFLDFYARRVLRIWPLYFFYVFLAFRIFPLIRPEFVAPLAAPHPWLPYIFFLQNFFTGPHYGFLFLGITWSIAVEEQFYLLWPFLVRYCRASSFTILLLAILGLEPALRFSLFRLGMVDNASIFTNVFCRLDGLAAGSLLAIYIRSARFNPARLQRFWQAAIPLGVLGFAAAIHSPSLRYSFPALGSAGFIGAAMYSRSTGLRKFLQFPPLLYTGRISYGLYLLHILAFSLARKIFSWYSPALPDSPLMAATFCLAATAVVYLMATVSWHILERPVLSLKKYFGGPSRTSLADPRACAPPA